MKSLPATLIPSITKEARVFAIGRTHAAGFDKPHLSNGNQCNGGSVHHLPPHSSVQSMHDWEFNLPVRPVNS